MIYGVLARLRSRSTALLAAAILATLPQYVYLARHAVPDMMLTVFLAAAMGCFAVGRFAAAAPRAAFPCAYAALALAVLTKGPVAAVVAFLAVALFWLGDIEERPGWPSAATGCSKGRSSSPR